MKKLLLLSMLLLPAAPAAAQTCFGGPSNADAPLRAGAAILFDSNAASFAGGITRAFGENFVTGGLVYQAFSDNGGSNKGFFGQAGTERAFGADGKYKVCPTAGVAKTWWGSDFEGDLTESILAFDFGAAVGFEASTITAGPIVPTFGLYFSHVRSSFEDFDTFTNSFLVLQAGVGIPLNEKIVIRPQIEIPFEEGANVGFGAVIAFKLGE